MSRVLVAWELGGDFGHINALPAVARRLRARGHEVVFALRDLARAEPVLGAEGFRVLQAPIWQRVPRGLPPAGNFAEILIRFGYLDSAGLTAMLRAWRSIYELVCPDLLLLDHAPTAALAWRGRGAPWALLGTGFTCPPPVSPLPAITPWLRVPARRLAEAAERVLTSANEAARPLGIPEMEGIADLHAADAQLLCTLEELDPFAASREAPEYLGPQYRIQGDETLPWPSEARPRVFGYLKARHPGTGAILDALAALPCAALVHCAGVSPHGVHRYAGAGLALTERHVHLGAAARESAFGVTHGSHGTTAAMLLAGCPVLMVPLQVEQTLTAMRVEESGAGVMVRPDAPAKALRRAAARLLEDPVYGERARALAARYPGYDPEAAAEVLAARVEALLERGQA